MDKLTEEEKGMLKYFWNVKRDISRYCDFEELIPKIQQEYPELILVWNTYQASIKIMNLVVDSIR